MESSLYSELKAAWHLDKIQALRRGEQISPAQIQLIISDFCNHDCSFCAYRTSGYPSSQNFGVDGNHNPNRMIKRDKALSILQDAAQLGVFAIQFTGGGEPTANPAHLEIFGRALDLDFECALVSNLGLLRKGWQDVLPRFEWIRVSIDAGCAETYGKIRRISASKFDTTLGNVRDLRDAIGSQATNCILGLSFIVTKENYREIRMAAEIAAELQLQIRFAAVFTPSWEGYYSHDELVAVREQLDAISTSPELSAFVIDMFDERVRNLQDTPDYSFCGYQHFNVYIGGDLKVYRCCNTAYNDLGEVGDLNHQSLADFWKSEEKRKNYGEFDAHSCDHCAFNNKNRMLNYLCGPEPQHVKFV